MGRRCPASLRSEFRRLIWVLINGELRPTYVQERGFQNRGRDGVISMRDNILQWLKFARWLDRQEVSQLSDCIVEHWKAYAAKRTSGCTRDHALTVLRWLSDLWAFDQLSVSPCGITQPPWESEGVDDYLPAATGEAGGENKTEPLDPTVIGPLLTWSIRLVEDFSDDILAAWAERRRMHARVKATPSTRGGLAAVKNYLQPLADSGALLPATVSRKHGITLAHHYVAAVTGASWNQVHDFATRRGLRALVARRPGPSAMQVPVTGRIEGRPWREFMDYEETPILVRHLATAAAIVILYLTGMRPQEAQSLRSGCCPDPEPNEDGSMPRHLIRSHHYKNVRDSDGHHISAGEERAVPWVAITPVVNAIRVLERIVPKGELLFSSTHHDVVSQRKHHGALKRGTLDRRVENLVSWINQEATAQGLDAQMVPEGPHGNLGLSRLRRTFGLAHRPPPRRSGRPRHPVRTHAHRPGRPHLHRLRQPRSPGIPRGARRRDRSRRRADRSTTARRCCGRREYLRPRRSPGSHRSNLAPQLRRRLDHPEGRRQVPRARRPRALRQPRLLPHLRLQARHRPVRPGSRSDGTQPVRLSARLRQRCPH